jgi:hypothetical protein
MFTSIFTIPCAFVGSDMLEVYYAKTLHRVLDVVLLSNDVNSQEGESHLVEQ